MYEYIIIHPGPHSQVDAMNEAGKNGYRFVATLSVGRILMEREVPEEPVLP